MESSPSPRVTARIVRTADGETIPEYEVRGVAYGSIDALSARLDDDRRFE